jgi:hypothetical protein
MAVVALKTTSITTLDAGQEVAVTDHGGRLRSIVGTVELGSADSIGSTYRLARLRSNQRVAAIWLFCDAITSAAADFGLYDTAANGGAVVDADAYASAQSIATAINKSPVNAAFEARDIANAGNRVWQDAGASADTRKEYDLVATLTAAATAAGTLTVLVEYVID